MKIYIKKPLFLLLIYHLASNNLFTTFKQELLLTAQKNHLPDIQAALKTDAKLTKAYPLHNIQHQKGSDIIALMQSTLNFFTFDPIDESQIPITEPLKPIETIPTTEILEIILKDYDPSNPDEYSEQQISELRIKAKQQDAYNRDFLNYWQQNILKAWSHYKSNPNPILNLLTKIKQRYEQSDSKPLNILYHSFRFKKSLAFMLSELHQQGTDHQKETIEYIANSLDALDALESKVSKDYAKFLQ